MFTSVKRVGKERALLTFLVIESALYLNYDSKFICVCMYMYVKIHHALYLLQHKSGHASHAAYPGSLSHLFWSPIVA